MNRVVAQLSARERQEFVDIWKAHWYQLFKVQGAAVPPGWHPRSILIHELLKRRYATTGTQRCAEVAQGA